ncbi:hypothetical protein AVEN_239375-1 [Araneus ventricosus]|uniref:Uncharacterized protein n=1 Tax=Araneus ventricosus TaxID=182803 RepID=A0A4Y2EB78_ARAVE|nr:hypothetical protein AVEN_239375-1 [Araneus ventricosus]
MKETDHKDLVPFLPRLGDTPSCLGNIIKIKNTFATDVNSLSPTRERIWLPQRSFTETEWNRPFLHRNARKGDARCAVICQNERGAIDGHLRLDLSVLDKVL